MGALGIGIGNERTFLCTLRDAIRICGVTFRSFDAIWQELCRNKCQMYPSYRKEVGSNPAHCK